MADDLSFDEFVLARSNGLLWTAYLLVRDEKLAEDLLQTALMKTWFAWRRIDGDPEPYVRRVLVTTAASWWRRRWTSELPIAELVDGPAGPSWSDGLAEAHDLWAALGRLPRRQRAVVILRYVEDRTEAETAELMGCSIGTVKSQATRGLAKLRRDVAMQVADEDRSIT